MSLTTGTCPTVASSLFKRGTWCDDFVSLRSWRDSMPPEAGRVSTAVDGGDGISTPARVTSRSSAGEEIRELSVDDD